MGDQNNPYRELDRWIEGMIKAGYLKRGPDGLARMTQMGLARQQRIQQVVNS